VFGSLFKKRSFLLLLALLVASIIISIYVPATRAFAIASFLLSITAVAAIRMLWNDSVSVASKRENKTEEVALRDSLAGMTSNVRSASRGSHYSKEEAAKILREALLSKFAEHGYPDSWISSQNGRAAIEDILKSNNSEDLIDVLEPSTKLNREEYLDKLDRALKLVEA
jgi:hypothetical protein